MSSHECHKLFFLLPPILFELSSSSSKVTIITLTFLRLLENNNSVRCLSISCPSFRWPRVSDVLLRFVSILISSTHPRVVYHTVRSKDECCTLLTSSAMSQGRTKKGAPYSLRTGFRFPIVTDSLHARTPYSSKCIATELLH